MLCAITQNLLHKLSERKKYEAMKFGIKYKKTEKPILPCIRGMWGAKMRITHGEKVQMQSWENFFR